MSVETLLKEIPVIDLEDNTLYAPVKGNVVSRNAIPDETFARESWEMVWELSQK